MLSNRILKSIADEDLAKNNGFSSLELLDDAAVPAHVFEFDENEEEEEDSTQELNFDH